VTAQRQRRIEGRAVGEIGAALDFDRGWESVHLTRPIIAEEMELLASLAKGQQALIVGPGYWARACEDSAASLIRIDPHDSPEALSDLPERSFDVVFLYGDPRRLAVMADIVGVLPLLRLGGVLVVHGYREGCCRPGVRIAVDITVGQIVGFLAGTAWVSLPIERLQLEML
jgi:hypothetical protein